MKAFDYRRAGSVADAVAAAGPGAAFLAGGTELVNWLRDGLAGPERVIDISRLPEAALTESAGIIRIGALARLEEIARHPAVRAGAPALAAAIEQSATAAIRSMGTLAGNLLQQTRCPYYRTTGPCNRRAPGSGCSQAAGDQRLAAVVGISDACVAAHPSDPAVALLSLDASLEIEGASGRRELPVADLYPSHGAEPSLLHTLAPGELIVAVRVPVTGLSPAGRFVKIRDRASFDFALVSAAGHCRVEGGRIRDAALALGGVAWAPWRCRGVEARLAGQAWSPDLVQAAVWEEFTGRRTVPGARYKVELAARAAAAALDPSGGAA